ncbi:MAG: PDZ domain-containing protein [Candidatus Omnitrophica bacterium]|nr:PDZ domain-containing protein [Candidatus Omnitrophota bacterium]
MKISTAQFICFWVVISMFVLTSTAYPSGGKIPKNEKITPSIPELARVEPQVTAETPTLADDPAYQQYIDFFEEVFQTMEDNYYQPPNRQVYDRFIEQFNTKIYSQLKASNKSEDFVRWRSAALMIEALKTDEDIFSAFYPPEPAKEYEETVLGVGVDLGLEGTQTEQGFQITMIEPRCDAYQKGLRLNDVIVSINEENITALEQAQVEELLKPMQDTKTLIAFLEAQTQERKEITVETISFFKQMVFPMTIKVPYIYGLEIRRFNRKTAEDIFRFLQFFREQGPMKGLVIDLRGNPGGPPLAAREIASFFLPAGEDFAFFQKKGQPKALLDVPEIPQQYKYDGPIVILVDKKSGSASELFSGVLQRRRRAVLMGENSAGQVMLKSMFHFDDDSMVLLITSRGFHPDGMPFSFNGLTPDRRYDDIKEEDIVDYATKYLVYINAKK